MTANPIQIQKFLKGVDYPATKDELRERARANEADDEVLGTLDALPDERYDSPADLSKAIGEQD